MKYIVSSVAAMLIAIAAWCGDTGQKHLNLRSRVELFRGTGDWREVRVDSVFEPRNSALIVCDMWDRHWCTGANTRVAALVKKLQPVIEAARRGGMTIVHAPSETMDHYGSAPERLRILSLPPFAPPKEIALSAPPLPIDDSDGGCDTAGDKEHRTWSCEHPGLTIAPEDFISDSGQEIYNLIRSRGIEILFYTGVHANMCILNRSFAIKQMTKWGMRCVLLRDLTDAMYGRQDKPFVSHQQGTELVIEYIEAYWAPTALSGDLVQGLR